MSIDEALDRLIDQYLDEGLNEVETEELNDLLLNSVDFRRRFKTKVGIHAKLVEVYQDQDHLFAYGQDTLEKDKVIPFNPWSFMAKVAVLVLACVFLLQVWQGQDSGSLATVSYSDQARWSSEIEKGDVLTKGKYTLEEGMVELELPYDVTVALQGPVSFSLIDKRTMQLYKGRLSADVGEKGKGFSVITPDGKVVDLGTRFGVHVPESGEVEAHVFQGEINVIRNDKVTNLKTDEAVKMVKDGEMLSLGVDDHNFPMPSFSLDIHFANSGFEEADIDEHWPTKVGLWGGDVSERVKSFRGVYPAEGENMMRFVKAHLASSTKDKHNNSQVWQLIDLHKFQDAIKRGGVQAEVSAKFNQLKDLEKDVRFQLSLYAYNGSMSDVKKLWDDKHHPLSELISQTSSKISADQDEETWEKVNVTMNIPIGTDFIVVELSAQDSSGQGQFEGHFVDDLTLAVECSPRKSSPSKYWSGSGRFKSVTNWDGGEVPDFGQDRIVIRGEGIAEIHRDIKLKQDMIVALHNEDEGTLRIMKKASLNISKNGSLIIGYNKRAVAKMLVEGTLRTACRTHIGRNNKDSEVTVVGLWDASQGSIRMSQYGGHDFRTRSTLQVMGGGKVLAKRFEMIHDDSKVILNEGKMRLERLLIGGDNGSAKFDCREGELVVDHLAFGPLKSEFDFGTDKASLVLKGNWTGEEIFQMEHANWLIQGRAARIQDFIFEEVKLQGQPYTVMRLKTRSS